MHFLGIQKQALELSYNAFKDSSTPSIQVRR